MKGNPNDKPKDKPKAPPVAEIKVNKDAKEKGKSLIDVNINWPWKKKE